MSWWTSLIQYSPFAACSTSRYSSFKKHEDSVEQAQQWVISNPIDLQTVRCLNIYESRDYGKQIIQSLKKIQVDSSNETIIKAHLVQICMINNLVQQYLFKHFSKVPGERKVVDSLKTTIGLTFPPTS
jgi:hypothetical protein